MEARLTPRRLLCAAALAALVSVTSACGGGGDAQAAANEPPLSNYTGSGLSFSYPAAWTANKPILPAGVLHFHPLVYLSTQAVHAPCTTHGNETSCDLPVRHLQPGGVLASWASPYLGPLSRTPRGKRIEVGGRPAWRTEGAGGDCRRIGADRTIEVEVELPNDGFVSLTACLRGPSLAQAEQSVDALLASTKFLSQ
ncbi:MAG: hypothetical protein ACJ75G_08320 [Gaiellaceae bacterium]